MKIKWISKYLLFLIVIGTSITSLSAKPLVAYMSDSLWHFLDDKGKEMFEAKRFQKVHGYSEGFFRVTIAEKGSTYWAFVDLKGKILTKLDCDFAANFSNGMALVYKVTGGDENNKKFTYLKRNGKLHSGYIYDDATEFSEGLAFVMNPHQRGYIDTNGKLVIALPNLASNCFREGLADVNTMDFKVGFMDKEGTKVIDYRFDESSGFSEGLAAVGMDGKYGYIDRQGKIKIKPAFDYANSFRQGRAFVAESDEKFNPLWALIDSSGEMLLTFQFNKVQDFSEGKAPVLKNKRWGFIDLNGSYIIQPKYYYCESFVDGLGWIADRENGVYGYINEKEELIIPVPKVESLIDLRTNRAIFE